MVRNYVKKTNGPNWTPEILQKALTEIRNGILTFYAAGKKYEIPRATLFDHMTGRRGQKSNNFGRPTALNADTEEKLANLISTMEINGFGLTRKEVVELVAEYVNKNHLQSPFKDGVPGYDWFTGFVKRNNLSIKKPQAVEYARKQAADPFVLDEYFQILENTIQKLQLQNKPHRIWNIDETSYCNDPKKTKIVGKKGFESTRTTAATGKDNTTVLFASNAAGGKGPPFIIYKGKNVWSEWTSPDAYEGTLYTATENGWIESKAFAEYFTKSFIPMLGTTDEPTLLIFDGHSTHIQLAVIEAATQNNVTIIKLPPHTSHLLQPLDLSVFKPFKDRWDDRMMKWQRCNYGQKLSKKEFSIIIGEVWRSLDPKIITNGFRKGGIFPLDRTVVSEDKLDQISLRKWKEYKKAAAINASHGVTVSSPSTLLSICLKKINGEEILVTRSPQTVISGRTNNEISFQQLLLNTIKKHESKVTFAKKRKIANGAEVITHPDVVKKLKQKEDENNKKKDNLKTRQKKTTTDKITITKKKKGPLPDTPDIPGINGQGSGKSSLQSENQDTKNNNPKKVIITSNIQIEDLSIYRGSINKKMMTNISNKPVIKLKKTRQDHSRLRKNAAYLQDSAINMVTKGTKKTDKDKGLKKQKKLIIKEEDESSTDDSDFSVHDVSDVENFADFCNSVLQDDDLNLEIPDFDDKENINQAQQCTDSSVRCCINDWVLVQFASKKTVKHFVGHVQNITNGIPTIKYARKIHKAKKDAIFAYPIIDDICDLKHSEDLVSVLPKPDISRRGHIIFKMQFDGFNVQ